MKDMDLTALTQEWFTRKARSPGSEMKDFILEKHLERHKSDPKSPEEKADFMESLQKSWAEKTQEYDAALDAYPDDPTLEQWQAVEMLNNVMQEFAASPAERFRYLLNVKYLVSCQLAAGQSETEADALQSALQESYEAKWRTASNASEAELQELLSETVRLMQYAGVQYNRDTRRILAKIGAGQDAVFSTKPSRFLKEDLRLLANFLTAEAVLSSKDLPCTAQEREFLAAEAVPVCVASATAARGGANPDRTESLAQSLIGKLCTKQGAAVLAGTAAVLLAAKAVVFALEAAAAGAVVAISLKTLWRSCREQRIPLTDAIREHLTPETARQKSPSWEEAPPAEETMEYDWEDELI